MTLTTQLFIERANVKHENRYSYEKTLYIRGDDKVIITCPVHGDFEQQASSHLEGRGCRKCGYLTRPKSSKPKRTQQDFITRAHQVHGDKFIYSKVNYGGSTTKITITCPIHGDFEQTPRDHLAGKGCRQCQYSIPQKSHIRAKNTFITRASKKHDNKFNYDKAVYKNARTNVTITCPIHGDFEQTPDVHLKAPHGCPKCATIAIATQQRSSTERFIKTAAKKYPGMYTYTNSVYITAISDIEIMCNRCKHTFTTTPNKHLNCGACSVCDKRGFDFVKPAILYYLSVNNGQAYKIGITNQSVQDRYSLEELSRISILRTWEYAIGKEAYDAEQFSLKEYKYAKYTGISLLKSGNTELFSYDVLDLDVSTYFNKDS